MAAIKYRDEHNKVGFLEKPKGSDDYHQILDFLRGSHIRYALTHDPIIYDSLVKQFWSTASLRASKEGPPAILATIDRTPYTITESLVRSQLQLDDEGGVEDLQIANIYLGMDNLGYPSEGKLTFFKNKFSPQWRFLVHTIMHCLSTKTGSWDQFGSQLAIAIICLTEGRRYNWSSYIFKGMVNNISNPKKFLMFPRFLQMILEIEPKNTKQYHAFKLTRKMFANMRLNFQGDHMPLMGTMLPPPQSAIAGESLGEDAPSNPQTGPSSDPNIASSSRPHESTPDLFTSTNVEDDTVGGSFHSLPPKSTQAPPEGITSGGAEDLDKLTALSSLVSTLVQKVNTQESDLQAHKLLFKEVVGKLVKRVKLLEDKIKGRKRKFVLTDSDKEEDVELDVDPLIKLAQAAATAAAAPTDGLHEVDIPPSSFIPTDEFASGSDVPAGATTGPSTVYPSSTIVPTTSYVPAAAPIPVGSGITPEYPSSPERDARKGKDVAWDIILARLQENPDLSSIIFRVEFNDDDFAARMVELLQEEFDKIQRAVAFTRGFKQDGSPKARGSSKKLKTGGDDVNLAATSHGVPQEEADILDAPVKAPSTTSSTAQHTGSSPKKVGTRKKRLGQKGVHPSHSTIPIEDGDPEAEHKMCIKYASDADSASDDDYQLICMLLLTGSYCLRDLKVLMDSPEVNDGSDVWKNQNTWSIQSWKLYSYSGAHVLETVDGLILHMFVDKKYPLSVNLIEWMLDHQLEICQDSVFNELTTAVQLIAFLKKQISNSRRPKVHDWYC
ncbi:hypothetical protein Tco_1143538 [Tanacetum coccineum]